MCIGVHLCVLTVFTMSVGISACPCAHLFAAAPLTCFCPSPAQILKLCPKKKSSFTYTFCKAVGLLGMRFQLFENECESQGWEGGSFTQTLGSLH